MGIAAAAATILGTGYSIYEQEQAKDAQEEAQERDRAIARAQAVREKRRQIREARIKRAQAVSQAYNTGGVGSTLSGATGSIGTQLGANVAFTEGTFRTSQEAAGFRQDAADSMFRAGIGSSVAGLSSNFATLPSFGNNTRPNDLLITTPRRAPTLGVTI